MPTVRVTCPECEHTFNVAESRVGGLVNCRDCGVEFRVEFAEDEQQPEPDERGRRKGARGRVDADAEPETWKTDLPIRSPMPLLVTLVCLQVLVAALLVVNWFLPPSTFSSPTTSQNYYYSYPTTKPTATSTPATRKW